MYGLPNDLRLQKLRNIRKISRLHVIIAQCPVFLPKCKFCQYSQNVTEKQKLNFFRSVIFHMKFKFCLKHFVRDCRSYKNCLDFDSIEYKHNTYLRIHTHTHTHTHAHTHTHTPNMKEAHLVWGPDVWSDPNVGILKA